MVTPVGVVDVTITDSGGRGEYGSEIILKMNIIVLKDKRVLTTNKKMNGLHYWSSL